MLAFITVVCVLIVILHCISKRRSCFWERYGIAGPSCLPFIGVLDWLGKYDFPDVFQLNLWTKEFGRTYGIQKGWVNVLVTSDPQIVNEMLTSKFEYFHERERLPMRSNVDDKVIHVFRARGARWRRLRALLQPIFSIQNLRKLLPTVHDSAKQMVKHLANSQKREVNAHAFCQEYSIDLILRLVMGQKGSQQFKTDSVQLLHDTLNDDRTLLSNISWVCPLLGPFCYKIRMWKSRFQKKGISILMGRIKVAIKEKKEARALGIMNENPDFIDFFLDSESSQVNEEVTSGVYNRSTPLQKNLTSDEIIAQLKFFSIAGFDTVSNTIDLLLFYLAKHRNVQEKLYEEFEHLYGNETILYEDLKELKYCDALINEVLRLNPIATNTFARTCTKPTTLGSIPIELGTIIMVDLFELHMDKELWGEDAKEFRPERWLLGNVPKNAYYPFGGGPRICIGQKLASIELKLALLEITRHFWIAETPNTGDAPVLVSNTVLNFPNVFIQLKKRQ